MKPATVILLLLAFATLCMPTAATSQELALYFPFEGIGDTVTDESGNGNDGAFDVGHAQRVASVTPRHGRAMKFESAERIAIPTSDSLDIDTQISFVMWVRLPDDAWLGVAGMPHIVSRTGDQHEMVLFSLADIMPNAKGSFAYRFGDNPGWQGAIQVDYKWRHIALTFDGTEYKVYRNGREAYQYQLEEASTRAFTGALYVGSHHKHINQAYDGKLDELAIYGGVLDQSRIQTIIDRGVLDQLPVEAAGRLARVWANLKRRQTNRD